MQTRTKWISGAVACGALLAALAPWPAGDSLRAQIVSGLAQGADVDAEIGSPVSFSLLPIPRVTFGNVRISKASGAISIEARSIVGKLRLLPLVAGRFEIAGLTLVEPGIELDISKLEGLQAKQLVSTGSTTTKDNFAQRFATVSISGGRARINTRAFAPVELSDLNAVLDWRTSGAPTALAGKADWKGERIDFSLLLGRPDNLALGRTSSLSLEVKSKILIASFDGELAALPRWQLDGKINASLPRAAQFFEMAGSNPFLAGGVDKISVTANTRVSANQINLSSAKIDIDENVLTGAINIQPDEEAPRITGTLAASALKIASRGSLLGGLADKDGVWNRDVFNLRTFSAVNMDLRISTTALTLGPVRFSDTAMSANNRNGRLELTMSAAKSYSGSVKARLSMVFEPALAQMRAAVQYENIDSAAFLRDMGAGQYLSGPATGEFDIRMAGTSVHQMMQHAHGSIQTEFAAGSVIGLDLDRALRQARTQPLSLPNELRTGGRTNFRRAQVAGTINGGQLTLTKGSAESETLSIALSGRVSLANRSLDLDIAATRPAPASPEMPARDPLRIDQSLQLDFKGPWNRPALQIDPESLINSSEAAAPLRRNLQHVIQNPATPGNGASPP